MDEKLKEVLSGKGENYMAPFFWQHGESDEALRKEIEKIQECGIQALCVESRPHEDFGGPGWWEDMDLILSECERRQMKVWLLDDKHFPTGYANGILGKKDRSLRRWEITERHLDVCGPVEGGMVLSNPWLEGTEDKILAVLACKREKEKERLTGKVIDLTGKLEDGLVSVTLPEGVYRIIFILQTRSQIPKWRSLYCDQLSDESMNALLEAVYEPHWKHYKKYFGTTFAGFFSDEPCFGNHNGAHLSMGKRFGAYPWREEVLSLLREEYRDEPLNYLPAFWFDMDPAFTAKARIGYMNVITRLYQKNFSEKLGGWCRNHGVSYIGHIIEDNNAHTKTGCSAGHFFRSMEGQDMAGIDVVLHQIIPGLTEYESAGWVSYETMDPVFFHYALAKLAASHSQLQPEKQGRAMCEMYGAYGWAEGVKMMKWLTDHMIVRGINFFVPHAFSPTFPDRDCPPHFYGGGHNPQYHAFGILMRYANRMCHLLSGGTHKASCGILYQAEAEWSGGAYMPMQVPAKLLYDRQIDYEFVPADYLLKAEAVDGQIRIGNQLLPCLVIPAGDCLPGEVVKKAWELSEAGVPVYYVNQVPKYIPGKEMAEGQELSFWCSEAGNRKVVPAEKLADVIIEKGLYDVTLAKPDLFLRTYHYSRDGVEYYMLFNENVNHSCRTEVNIKGFCGGWYGVYDGLENSIVQKESTGGAIAVDIPPYQSRVLVFGPDREPGLPVEPDREVLVKETEIGGKWELSLATEQQYPDFRRHGALEVLENMAAAHRLPHFSGHFLYQTVFSAGTDSMPEEKAGQKYVLDLGKAGESVFLTLNGRQFSGKIVPPYCYDVTDVLKRGENRLEIEVVNHLGYEQRDGFSKFLLMEPTGLLGPVRLLTYEAGVQEGEGNEDERKAEAL